MRPPQHPPRILLCSWAFPPSIGGIETSSLFLAERLHRHGLAVTVVTQTPADDHPFPFPVIRQPSPSRLLELVRQSDLVYQNNISLHYLWPLLLVRRPLIIVNHTPIDETIEHSRLKRSLKFLAMRHATACISCSHYLASTFPVPSRVIHNPYRSAIFRRSNPQPVRDRQLVFFGRLARAKGVDILFHALALLRDRGLRPALTLIGGGAEQQPLSELAARLNITDQITFLGPLPPQQAAALLERHQVLVVPSRCQPAEAFPFVPLEAIACGAVPVVANQGGLPETIGPCGILFPVEDPHALADTLAHLLAHPEELEQLRAHAPDHLARFQEDTIFLQSLSVVQQALPHHRVLDPTPA